MIISMNGKTVMPPAYSPTPSWRAIDVAQYFGVQVRTVYKWVYNKSIPFHRTPGGGLRFVEAEVKEVFPERGTK